MREEKRKEIGKISSMVMNTFFFQAPKNALASCSLPSLQNKDLSMSANNNQVKRYSRQKSLKSSLRLASNSFFISNIMAKIIILLSKEGGAQLRM